MMNSLNWADVLGKDLAYVVLRKGNRLQVILRPTGKQLRVRGKRNWQVIAAGGSGDSAGPFDPPDELRVATVDALAELVVDDGKAAKGKKRKPAKA